jgi:hypothetical protein
VKIALLLSEENNYDNFEYLEINPLYRLLELAEVFGGAQKLQRIQPNKNLEKWLRQRGQLSTILPKSVH